MIAKVIVHQKTRAEAIATMKRALREFMVEPIKTTIPACLEILSHNLFAKGKLIPISSNDTCSKATSNRAWIQLFFQSDQIFVGFAFSNDFKFVAIDEDFCGTAAGVVIAAHSKAVSSRGKDCQNIASFYRRQSPVFGEEIRAFANRADNVKDFAAFGTQIFITPGRNKFFRRPVQAR